MLKRCKIKVQKSEQETYKTKVCKYHSYGSSKRGSSCHFVHSLVDCKEHMKMSAQTGIGVTANSSKH